MYDYNNVTDQQVWRTNLTDMEHIDDVGIGRRKVFAIHIRNWLRRGSGISRRQYAVQLGPCNAHQALDALSMY